LKNLANPSNFHGKEFMMSYWVLWLAAAGILAVAELMTGTLYLLIFAVGAAVACLAAYAGLGLAMQILAAAVTSFAGWLLLKKLRPARKQVAPESNPNLNMDIGTVVRIASIENGRVTVMHRGTKWDAAIEGNRPALMDRDYVIKAVRGAQLILSEQ
jgi:membrane protein implicated in regulation of membrane protease activity